MRAALLRAAPNVDAFPARGADDGAQTAAVSASLSAGSPRSASRHSARVAAATGLPAHEQRLVVRRGRGRTAALSARLLSALALHGGRLDFGGVSAGSGRSGCVQGTF